MASDDPSLQALLLPFEAGLLTWPGQGDVLFLQARDGWPLAAARIPRMLAVAASKPDADRLERAGYRVGKDATPSQHPLVLTLPPRQRDEMRALFTQAFDRCESGGRVIASVANDAGAKSAEADFRKLAGVLDGSLSKHRCRVFWADKDESRIDPGVRDAWRQLDAPRWVDAPHLPAGGFMSRPGVFAWDRIDPASALLAAQLPCSLSGHGADLGAGWGYLAIEVLRRNPRVQALDLYEAQARALELAKHNLSAITPAATLDFLWHDVTAGLPKRYDFIVSNPPFHTHDRADRPELGRRFIEVAAQSLHPHGRLLLVANRHLPYESTLAASFGEVRVLAQQGGFKAVEASRPVQSKRRGE